MKAVKRAELAQCSLVIALGGVIIYNQIITTTDGNYTTVTVLTNYPTGATTLIITENCPGPSATGITVGGVTVGLGGSSSSSYSFPPSTAAQSTSALDSTSVGPSTPIIPIETAAGPSSPPPLPASSFPYNKTATTAPFTTPIQLLSSTATQAPATVTAQGTSTTRAISDFYNAPPYTSGFCTRPMSFYTAGCTLSGAPLAPTGLLAMASGIPNVKSYSNNGDESMSDEMCASFCASFDDCHSWALDRGYNWPDDDGHDWWCYIYSGNVRQYAVSYDFSFRQVVWNGRGCYDCHGASAFPSSTSAETTFVAPTDTPAVEATTPPTSLVKLSSGQPTVE